MTKPITYAELDKFMRRLDKEDYHSRLNYFRWMEYPLALTLLEAEEDMKILEVGTGFLSISPLYLISQYGCEVTAIDKREFDYDSRYYVDEIGTTLGIDKEKLTIQSMDATELKFPNESFDRVLAISMVEHLPFFMDSVAMKEMGRVLKPDGKIIVTVPFNLGNHIEDEQRGGEEYQQRHYNEFTIRERITHPTLCKFKKAIAFGEVDQEIGTKYLEMSPEQRRKFCLKNKKRPEKFWREYYRIEDQEEFILHRPRYTAEALEKAGVIALVLEKEEEPPKSYFYFDPIKSYLENNKLCKNPGNWPNVVVIEDVRIQNSWSDKMNVFQSGESMHVKIVYRCTDKIEHPSFWLVFQDQFDNTIAAFNSTQANCNLDLVSGTQELSITFGMLNLMPGQYKLTVSVWTHDVPNPLPPIPYDVWYQHFDIEVKKRLPGLAGVVFMPYTIGNKKMKD